MRLIRLIILFALFAAAAPVEAQSRDRASIIARIDSIAEDAVASKRSGGLTVAVVRGTDTLVLRGYGLADLENNVPITDRTVFRIGSLTKQFTAAAVMKLVEQGKIRLDGTLKDYLPDYAGPGGQVTIHQLLNHTSGIPSYTNLGDRFLLKSRLDLSHAEVLEMFGGEALEFEPGTSSRYNNSAFFLLGMILERVSGESYADLLKRTQFEPLGLKQTSYCSDSEIVPHRASGYALEQDRLVNAAPLSMTLPFAAGALCSTPRDLVRWTDALANGRVVTRASFERMITPTTLAGGGVRPYGYGLVNTKVGEHTVFNHSGGINGFSAFMAHYPAGGKTAEPVTIVVIANGPVNTGVVQEQIARVLFNLPPREISATAR